MRAILLAAALAFATAGSAPAAEVQPQAVEMRHTRAEGLLLLAYFPDERLYKKCRRKVRRAYGWVKGRHSLSLRLAYIEQCVAAGGRLV